MSYISFIWFKGWKGGNIMSQLSRPEPDGEWEFTMRFRHYVDDKHHESDDMKSGLTMKAPGSKSEDEVIAEVRDTVDKASDVFGPVWGDLQVDDFIDLKCESNDPKLMIELMSRDWCHVKMLHGDEAKEMTEKVRSGEARSWFQHGSKLDE